MRGRPGRRGGSKACLSIGASYHWYPWDLYVPSSCYPAPASGRFVACESLVLSPLRGQYYQRFHAASHRNTTWHGPMRPQTTRLRGGATVYVTTVVSSEVGHVTIFERSGTWVFGEGTSRIFGLKATSAVILSQWENGALLFVWILTIKRFVLFQRYNMFPKVQSILYTSQSDSLRKHESLSCENRCK